MSLRIKLLLVALSTLALPWAGWQFVKQTESLLRQGQEQALLASAGTLAKAFAATGAAWPAPPVLYVQTLDQPVTIDGYADDWPDFARYAQSLGPARDPDKLHVLLGERDADLYLLTEARDATRTRVDARDPRARESDHVTLVLERGAETRRYLLASAAPGFFDAHPDRGGAGFPDRLPAAWQEDGSGYRVELRIPHEAWPDRIGVRAFDASSPDRAEPDLRPLLTYDTAAARALDALVPDHACARIVTLDAWRIADAGTASTADDESGRSGWLDDLVYRSLIAPALTGSPALDGDPPRLDAGEVWQALSGLVATSWRAGDRFGEVVLTAAVPLHRDGEVVGALVLEQANRALPLLANRALFGLAGATLAALAIAALILLAFGATLSFRIRRLRNAAERAVRTGGRLTAPLPLIDAEDELGDLARSFGKLFDEVGAYTDYLGTLASKLSHELHTPLAIVKSSLDNLDHQTLPPDARAYASRARDGAERLGKIVRAMSESSRIERAIASAEAEDFDLAALVKGSAESYRALAEGRAVKVAVAVGEVPFHGAPDLIAQALDKLFDNARSFTPAGGAIELRLARVRDGVELRVVNDGPPLPETMQDRLFDSLISVRGSDARAGRETPHLGLGLYVVRLVAELHRGKAEAHNRPDGRGVEFLLRLAGMPRRRLSED